MLKSKREKALCDKYSTKDKNGKVHCYECPLQVKSDESDTACKAWMHYDKHEKCWVIDEESVKSDESDCAYEAGIYFDEYEKCWVIDDLIDDLEGDTSNED